METPPLRLTTCPYQIREASSKTMSSATVDDGLTMKQILDALKSLQLNQAHLAGVVDAISGRVNVLAGMKEVRDAASSQETVTTSDECEPYPHPDPIPHSRVVEPNTHEDVPESPSLPATQLGQVDGNATSDQVGPVRKQSVTSRIILT